MYCTVWEIVFHLQICFDGLAVNIITIKNPACIVLLLYCTLREFATVYQSNAMLYCGAVLQLQLIPTWIIYLTVRCGMRAKYKQPCVEVPLPTLTGLQPHLTINMVHTIAGPRA